MEKKWRVSEVNPKIEIILTISSQIRNLDIEGGNEMCGSFPSSLSQIGCCINLAAAAPCVGDI